MKTRLLLAATALMVATVLAMAVGCGSQSGGSAQAASTVTSAETTTSVTAPSTTAPEATSTTAREETTSTSASAPSVVQYDNSQYGFLLSLPESWKGYTVVAEEWEGLPVDAPEGDQTAALHGPLVLIRHPAWTEKEPRQDIPIMVFTPGQWEQVQQGKLSLGAAPIPPTELGRNASYVFALPARYNYAFPTGWEEVESIMQRDPLRPTAPASPPTS